MNLSTILPRLLQIGFQPRQACLQGRATPVAPPQLCTMTRRAIMPLENRRVQLRVLRGWVWITRDGCPADMVLGAGDVFDQQPGARVLVQAFEEAERLIAGADSHAHNA
jgi:hypothetical protein